MGSLDFEAEKISFRTFYDQNLDKMNAAIGSFETLVRSLLQQADIGANPNIVSRVKSREECISKFTRKYRTELEKNKTPYTIREKITDMIGLRVICLYEDEVDVFKEAITKEFEVLDITDKTALIEDSEDTFGYKGLHLDLKLSAARMKMPEYRAYSDHPFELQIRTVVQDSWSVIDHKIKYKKSIPKSLKRRINTLAALFELADREFRAIRDATTAEIKQTESIYPDIEAETSAAEDDKSIVNGTTKEVVHRKFAHLDAFNFSRIAQHFFPDFELEPRKIDGFTNEIVSLKPGISRGKFNFYMREKIAKVKQYQLEFESTGEKMNEFTVMRHCLYAGDKSAFQSMLTDTARLRFDEWLVAHSGPQKSKVK